MVDHKNKHIFVHIPKTGGESINSLYRCQDPSIPKHANYRQIEQKMGEEMMKNYFVYSVVRNPFDLVVSMYEHLRKPVTNPEETKKKYGMTFINPVNACHSAIAQSFKEYCITIFIDKQHQVEQDRPDWPVNHFAPQWNWLMNNKGILNLHAIVRFERLEYDLGKLPFVTSSSFAFPHLNASKRKPFQNYYDEETREIVYQHYRKDFKNFNYSFSSCNLGVSF